jgi:hypothetical protein
MSIKRKRLYSLWTLALGAALPVQAVIADEARLRIVFAEVPATSKIAEGDLPGGIEQIEDRLEQDPEGTAGDDLATLCGAYVLQASFGKAELVCDLAVQIDASGVALNNRGVLRALTGDVEGARADFDQVRPKNMTEYMNDLRQSDLGLVTAGNFELLNRTIAMRRSISSHHITGAKVEDITNQP